MTDTQKDLFLIRGLPGAGKTTFAEALMQEGDVLVATDDFLMNDQGEYEWSPEKLKEAISLSHTKAQEAMKQGVSRIFVPAVFDKAEHMQQYYALAGQYGYRVFSIVVENRHGGTSIHPVSEETIKHFREEFDITL